LPESDPLMTSAIVEIAAYPRGSAETKLNVWLMPLP